MGSCELNGEAHTHGEKERECLPFMAGMIHFQHQVKRQQF
jgi:hypothetical protein